MIRSVLVVLAGALLVTTACAAPALKADIVVTGSVVTVGDMFEDAGLDAETGLFRAPRPGTTGLVSLADVTAAAARIGLTEFNNGALANVRVTRAAAIVDETSLAQLISADLAARGIITQSMSAQTMFSRPIVAINAEAVAEPAKIMSLRYLPGTGTFTARFAIAGVDQPLDVGGTIDLMIEAPHLKASLPAGAVLTTEDIDMRPISLRFAEATGIAPLNELVGKALTRQSRDGMMLKATDVTTPQLIAKNDLVTIYFRKGPMTLSVKGQAVTSAATGGPVQVINLMSKRIISATAIAAGAVEVDGDPLALAGL